MALDTRLNLLIYLSNDFFQVLEQSGKYQKIDLTPGTFTDFKVINPQELEKTFQGSLNISELKDKKVILILSKQLLFSDDKKIEGSVFLSGVKNGDKFSVGTNPAIYQLVQTIISQLGGHLVAVIPISLISTLSNYTELSEEVLTKTLNYLNWSKEIDFLSLEGNRQEINSYKRWYQKNYSWKILALILILYSLALVLALVTATHKVNWSNLLNTNSYDQPILTSVPKTDLNQTVASDSSKQQVINKSNVSILVLNGTGIAGQAGKVKSALVKLGYQDITTDNSNTSSNQKTTVFFDPSIDQSTQNEISSSLKNIFSSVMAESSSSSKYQIQITTGLQKSSAF